MSVVVACCQSFISKNCEGEGCLKLQKFPIELPYVINSNFAVVVALVIFVTIVVV